MILFLLERIGHQKKRAREEPNKSLIYLMHLVFFVYNVSMMMCLSFFLFGFGLSGLYFKYDLFFYLSYVILILSGVGLGIRAFTENMNRNQRLANNGINWKHRTCAIVGALISLWATPWIMSFT